MTPSSKSIAWTACAAVFLCLAGCGEGSDASGPGRMRSPAESGSPALRESAGRLTIAGDGQSAAAPAVSRRKEEIVIREGRARARVRLSSERPVVVLAGERYPLVGPDGTFDRETAESLFAALEAAGPFLEIELIMPPEVPGNVVEQLVFFMEEKGRVPIVSAPPED